MHVCLPRWFQTLFAPRPQSLSPPKTLSPAGQLVAPTQGLLAPLPQPLPPLPQCLRFLLPASWPPPNRTYPLDTFMSQRMLSLLLAPWPQLLFLPQRPSVSRPPPCLSWHTVPAHLKPTHIQPFASSVPLYPSTQTPSPTARKLRRPLSPRLPPSIVSWVLANPAHWHLPQAHPSTQQQHSSPPSAKKACLYMLDRPGQQKSSPQPSNRPPTSPLAPKQQHPSAGRNSWNAYPEGSASS